MCFHSVSLIFGALYASWIMYDYYNISYNFVEINSMLLWNLSNIILLEIAVGI